MVVYFSIAAGAAFVSYLARRTEQQSKAIAVLLYTAAIVIFCHFAGARDLKVGTDTSFYAYNSYKAALSEAFNTFWRSSEFGDWGPLYKLLCWTSVNFARSFYGYLFCIELLTVIPLVIAAREFLGDYLWFGVYLFGILFYPMSFNMMRQMIAMSFLLLAFIAASGRKPLKYIIWLMIAIGFHTSAILGILFYPLILFSRDSTLGPGLKLIIIFCAGIAFVGVTPKLILMLPGNHFQWYISDASLFGGGIRMITLTMILAVVLGLLGFLFTRGIELAEDDRLSLFELLAIFCFGVICLLLSLLSFYLYRIAFIFIYVVVLMLPKLCSAVKDSHSRYLMIAVAIIATGVWSTDYYFVQQSHEVIPYIFSTI